MNCLCCLFKKLIAAVKDIKVTIPQPLDVNCDVQIPQPLEVSGTVTCNTTIPQPLQVEGNITVNNPQADPCAEAMLKILSQSNAFTEIVFKNDEQYQKVTNLTVDGYVVTFESQGQTIFTTPCNIEYVVK